MSKTHLERVGPAILTVVIPVGLAVTLCLADTPEPPAQSRSELAELREEVAQLRKRVEDLERHLEYRVIIPMPRDGEGQKPRIRAIPIPRDRLVPEGSVPYEFNGMRFYVIPLDAAQAKPVKRKR